VRREGREAGESIDRELHDADDTPR
jgi:hypothetical protein